MYIIIITIYTTYMCANNFLGFVLDVMTRLSCCQDLFAFGLDLLRQEWGQAPRPTPRPFRPGARTLAPCGAPRSGGWEGGAKHSCSSASRVP